MFVHTTGFTRGEVDEALWDRVDVDFYRSASRLVENWFPDLTGAIQRRPGFEMAEVVYSDATEGYDTSKGVPGSASRVACAIEPLVVEGHQFLVQVLYWEDPGPAGHIRVWRVDLSTEPFQLSEEATAPLSFDALPAGAALVDYLCVARAGPAMFVTSPLFAPQRVYYNRAGDTGNVEAVTWYSELLGKVKLSHNSATVEGTDTLFSEQLSNGDTIKIRGAEYTVSAVDSNTKLTLSSTYSGPTLEGLQVGMKLSASDAKTAMGGHPRLCAFHRGRLFLFTTAEKPTGMWASAPQDPFMIIAGGAHDDAPINYELLAEGAEGFVWVAAAEQLHLGSPNGEYQISSHPDEPITATHFGFSRTSSVGGAPVPPVQNDASTVYVSRGRNQVLASVYEYQVQGFTSKDLSLLAGHLMAPGVRQLALRPATGDDRVPRLFMVTQDGQMRACALYEREEVTAWSRVTLPEGDTPASLAASADQLYVTVARPAASGPPALYITRLTVPADERYVMDYSLPYSPADTVQLEEPHHGFNLAVISESRGFLGYFQAENGALDLSEVDYGTERLWVGVSFRSRLELLPVSVVSEQGEASLNRRRRVVQGLMSVRGAYQLFVNGVSLFGATGVTSGTELPRQDGVFAHRMLGWGDRDEFVIEEPAVYRARILSVSREVVL